MVKDSNILDKVQQRAMEWVKGLQNMERLKVLSLTTLPQRRLRRNLIEVGPIPEMLTGKEDIDPTKFFMIAPNDHGLRDHRFRLYKHRPMSSQRLQIFLSRRIINVWNGLRSRVVEAPSVDAFQNRLDDFQQETDT